MRLIDQNRIKNSATAEFLWNYIMLVIAALILLTPVFSIVEFDYTNPDIVKVETQKDETGSHQEIMILIGDKQISLMPETTTIFSQRFGLSISWWQLMVLSFALVYLVLLVNEHFKWGRISHGDDYKIEGTIIATVALILLLVPFIDPHVEQILKQRYDNETVGKLMEEYWRMAFFVRFLITTMLWMVVSLVSFFIFDSLAEKTLPLWKSCFRLLGRLARFFKSKGPAIYQTLKAILRILSWRTIPRIFWGIVRLVKLMVKHEESISIDNQGQVQVKDKRRIKFIFLPLPNKLLAQKKLEDLFSLLFVNPDKNVVLWKMRNLLMEDYKRNFSAKHNQQLTNDIMSAYTQVCEQAHKSAMTAVMQSEEKSLNSVNGKVMEIVQNSAYGMLKEFRNRLSKQTADELADILHDIKQEVIKEISLGIKDLKENKAPETIKDELPENTVYYQEERESGFILVEQNPGCRTIFTTEGKFYLAFPYVYFLLTFFKKNINSIYIYFSNTEVRNNDDMLYIPNLSNVRENLSVCLNINNGGGTLKQNAEKVMRDFWNSEFNDDLKYFASSYGNKFPQFKDYKIWEKCSKKDPDFPLSIQWEKWRTLKEALKIQGFNYKQDSFQNLIIKQAVNEAFSKKKLNNALLRNLTEIEITKGISQKAKEILDEKARNFAEDIFDTVKAALQDSANFKLDVKQETIQNFTSDLVDQSFAAVRNNMVVNLSPISPTDLITELKHNEKE